MVETLKGWFLKQGVTLSDSVAAYISWRTKFAINSNPALIPLNTVEATLFTLEIVSEAILQILATISTSV